MHESGIIVTVRRTRGDDIEAACGQLAGDVMDRTKRAEKFRIEVQTRELEAQKVEVSS